MSEQTCFVTDHTCNGKCSNCGQCCSDLLPLSEREVRDIKAYMKEICLTLPPASYDITFIFYDYPPESTTVSELVTALDQETDTTTEMPGLGASDIRYHAKLIYLF